MGAVPNIVALSAAGTPPLRPALACGVWRSAAPHAGLSSSHGSPSTEGRGSRCLRSLRARRACAVRHSLGARRPRPTCFASMFAAQPAASARQACSIRHGAVRRRAGSPSRRRSGSQPPACWPGSAARLTAAGRTAAALAVGWGYGGAVGGGIGARPSSAFYSITRGAS
jgi:hypothetical protein